MASRGKTIKIFLVEDEPDGLRTAELSNWVGQAVVIPRKKLKGVLKDTGNNIKKYPLPSLDKPGFYFLVGKNEERALSPVVYIGEAEDIRQRLKSYHKSNDKKKDFWQTIVAFINKDKNLTKTHMKYLESRCIEIAKSANRSKLQNRKDSSLPTLSDSDRAIMEEYLDYVKLLLPNIGYPILQKLQKPQEPTHTADEEIESEPISDDRLFTCKGKKHEAEAEGYWSNEGFVVCKGSTASVPPKDIPTIAKLTEKLHKEKILKKHNGGKLYIFDEDYIFNSPSSASRAILGRSSNGWAEWKTKDGKTLDEIYRLQEPADKTDEEIEPEPISDDLLFTCRGRNGAKAKGHCSNKKLVVYKGSTANAQPKDIPTITKLIKKLLSENILKKYNGEQFIFVEDYIFNSPSAASGVILGYRSNGWKNWKAEDGKTLHEIYKSQESQKPQEPAHKADEEIEPEPISDDLLFTCRGRNGAKAKGYWSNKKLVVYKGSTANVQVLNTFPDSAKKLTDKLLSENILKKRNNKKLYIFVKNYIFRTPSAASSIIVGRSSNGRAEWKTEDGKTLGEIYRK